jgi:hypothetical protein
MPPSPVTDMKAFVPDKDLDVSKAFYADLGFTINWSNDGIAALQINCFGFRLQKFFVARHAGNFMMGPSVDDADAWRSTSRKSSFPKSTPVQAACDATLGPANTET